MKRLIFLFVLLFGAFLGTWTYKIKTPVERPDEYAEGYDPSAGAWYLKGKKVETDEDWRLDPTIEPDYIPVPGEDNLFMQVDKDGNIIKYRKRIKQIDGTWIWEDVNPDIPDDYEAVEGLENVYKVTDKDGNVKYLKYIRNSNDTFAFVEVDENGELIEHNTDATSIDSRHVHITGNMYKLVDDHGVTIAYEKRIQNDDGTFSWSITPLDLSSLEEDSGMSLGDGGQEGLNVDSGFLDSMAANMAAANAQSSTPDVYNVNINPPQNAGDTYYVADDPQVINNSDGTHTQIEVVRESKIIDGSAIVYETTVTKTYDSAGNLLSSDAVGPYEVSRELAMTTNTNPGESSYTGGGYTQETIEEEYAHSGGKYSYNDQVASELIALINAQRAEKGLGAVSKDSQAEMVAKLRAADMATYNVTYGELPSYGALGTMLSYYKIGTDKAGEALLKIAPRSADEIDTRFETIESSRTTLMKEGITSIGIAVLDYNGFYYVAEVVW